MLFNPVEIIRKKRDGKKLSSEEISFFIKGIVEKNIPDYQATAWLMSVFLKGMSIEETVSLTEAMTQSGETIQFKDNKPKIDKHSTGGIGDKVSLLLSPMVSSLGVDVPMVSGRGLGHTGGTLDKLENIPGFNVRLTNSQFIEFVEKTGMAMMGQSDRFVPADKKLYALRDVTATVECIPLITASILSKKKAEGISGLVLDVKVGSGAFMKSLKEAEKLAKSLVFVGQKLKLKMTALLTDMSQTLGQTAGHHLEVLEVIELLKGNEIDLKKSQDLVEVTLELAAHMLLMANKTKDLTHAKKLAYETLINGKAYLKFQELCLNQGVSKKLFDDPQNFLKVSPHKFFIKAPKTSFIGNVNGQELGLILIELGGGRKKTSDPIDPSVGFRALCKIGEKVKKDQEILEVFFQPNFLERNKTTIKELQEKLLSCYSFSMRSPKKIKMIKKVLLSEKMIERKK